MATRLPGRPIGGGTLRGGRLPGRPVDEYTSALQGKSSQERAALEKRRQTLERDLRAKGFNSAVAGSASRIMVARAQTNVSRPMQVLGAIGRGLGAIEQAGAGYLRGVTESVKEGKGPGGLLAIPWAVGAGVKDIPGAVREEYGYAQYLKDQVDPKDTTAVGKWIHRNAGPIGFGMSLVFDPTMYLSFGATAASKNAAYGIIAAETRRSVDDAAQIMARDGIYNARKWDDPEELMLQIHRDTRRPMNLPQALSKLRETGLEEKAAARRGQRGVRKAVTGVVLPTNVRGGRGVRFAGLEIPGTPQLGAAMGRGFRRRQAAKALAPKGGIVTKGIGGGFVPKFRTKLIADDMTRALALSDLSRFRTETMRARMGAEEAVGRLIRRPTAAGEEIISEEERRGALLRDPIVEGADVEKPVLPLWHGSFRENFERMDERSGWIHLTPDPQLARRYGDHLHRMGVPEDAKVYDATRSLNTPIRKRLVTGLTEAIDDPDRWPAEAVERKAMQQLRNAVGTGKIKSFDDLRKEAEKIDDKFGLTADDGYLAFVDDVFKEVMAPKGWHGMKHSTSRADVEAMRTGQKPTPGGRALEPLEISEGLPEYSIWDQSVVSHLGRQGDLTPTDDMVREIGQRVEQEVSAAKAAGLSERASREMWEHIRAEVEDPAAAAAQFMWRNQSKILARQFLDQFLENPMFAKEIKGDALAARLDPGRKIFVHEATKKRYSVLGEIADALEDLQNPVVIEKGTNDLLRLMNLPQSYWKMFATLPNPSFHVMNGIGAIWNNMLGDLYNPADYVRAIATVYRAKVQQASERGERVLGQRAVSTAKTREAAALVREAETRGALGNVSILAEFPGGEELARLASSTPPTVQARLKSAAVGAPGRSIKRKAATLTRRGIGVGLAASMNPVAIAAFAPEIAAAGRVASSAMEDVVRMAPFIKASKDPVLKQYLHAYGPITVAGNKHPSFNKAQQEAMYDIAAENVRHFQFDYTDLTDFERKWAKTIFPFYTFYRKNFVLQAQMLAQKPRNTVAALTAINYLNENADISDPMQEMLPDYFENIQAVAVPVPDSIRGMIGLPKDEPLFLNPKLPFLTLNMMPPIWNVFRDTGQPTKQKVLAAFAPMLGSIGPWAPFPIPGTKMMLEASVGESLGLNKTIDYQRAQSNDWRNSYVPAPPWVKYLPGPVRDFMGIFPWIGPKKTQRGEWIMTATGQYILDTMATPFVTNLGQTIPVGGPGYEGQKARADLVSWMTGVRLIPVDTLRMHRSWGYRLKSMLESRKADLEDQGKRMEPEDMMTLRQVKSQLEVLERAWDRRQYEMYGPEHQRR